MLAELRFYLDQKRKGIGMPMKAVIGAILMIAFVAIILGFAMPAAEQTGEAASCSSQHMKIISSIMADMLDKGGVFCQ